MLTHTTRNFCAVSAMMKALPHMQMESAHIIISLVAIILDSPTFM